MQWTRRNREDAAPARSGHDESVMRRARRPLLSAANNGRLLTAEVLLQHGADPNAGNKNNWTPLAAVAYKGDHDIVKLLLAYRADVRIPTASGRAPWSWQLTKATSTS